MTKKIEGLQRCPHCGCNYRFHPSAASEGLCSLCGHCKTTLEDLRSIYSGDRSGQLFDLMRDEDLTGVSGTGRVAEGVEFADGTCVMHWTRALSSTTVYDSLGDLIAIHGHDGRTRVVFR